MAPPPQVRDAQIAAAVAAFSAAPDAAAGDDEPALTPAVPLAPRREARSGRTRNRWLAVAAAVAAIALAVPLINAATHQSGTDLTAAPSNEAAASTTTLTALSSGPGASPSTAPPATAGGPSTTAAPPTAGPVGPDDVGAASSPEELASLVRAAEPQLLSAPDPTTTVVEPDVTSTLPPATPEADDCDTTVRSGTPGLGTLVVATSAMFQGARVDVLVYAITTSGTTTYRILAVDPVTCAVVVDRVL